MNRRNRLVKGDTNYTTLRSTDRPYHSRLNVLAVGLFTAHLIEREYAVYTRITANQEMQIRIYSDEDKYELIIYSNEDARPLLIDACKTLGGAKEFEHLIGLLHQLERAEQPGEPPGQPHKGVGTKATSREGS